MYCTSAINILRGLNYIYSRYNSKKFPVTWTKPTYTTASATVFHEKICLKLNFLPIIRNPKSIIYFQMTYYTLVKSLLCGLNHSYTYFHSRNLI